MQILYHFQKHLKWISPIRRKKKRSGYIIIKPLTERRLIVSTQIYNEILRIGHSPYQWKVGQIILIHKPEKPVKERLSYRSISFGYDKSIIGLTQIYNAILRNHPNPQILRKLSWLQVHQLIAYWKRTNKKKTTVYCGRHK